MADTASRAPQDRPSAGTAAPASLPDIRPTLLAAAGPPHAEEGSALTELSERQARTRYFYRATGRPRAIYEYSIGTQDANEFGNWSPTGRVYAPPENGFGGADAPDGAQRRRDKAPDAGLQLEHKIFFMIFPAQKRAYSSEARTQ